MRRIVMFGGILLLMGLLAAGMSQAQSDVLGSPNGSSTTQSSSDSNHYTSGSSTTSSTTTSNSEKYHRPRSEIAAIRKDLIGANESSTGTAGHETAVMSESDVHEWISIIHDLYPERAQHLETEFKESPDRVKQKIISMVSDLYSLREAKRQDKALYDLKVSDLQLNRATQELASQFRQAAQSGDNSKSDGLKTQLHSKIAEHFAVRQRIQEHELSVLEKKIENLRGQIAARKGAADKLIEERFSQLTSPSSKPGW